MIGRIPMVDVAETSPISNTELLVVCEAGHRILRPRKRRQNVGPGLRLTSVEDPPPKRVRCIACAAIDAARDGKGE